MIRRSLILLVLVPVVTVAYLSLCVWDAIARLLALRKPEPPPRARVVCSGGYARDRRREW